MQWELITEGQIVLSVRVDHELLDWLRPCISDYAVAQLDPFRDTVLDGVTQQRWLKALGEARDALCTNLRASVELGQRLPTDPQARERIVRQLVNRDYGRLPWAGILDELTALLELAVDSGGAIRVLGD